MKTRLKELEGKGVKISYLNKLNQKDTIHGKLNFVSRDRIIVTGMIDFVIDRSKIQSVDLIVYEAIKK